MTNVEESSNDQMTKRKSDAIARHLDFVIPLSFVIRASSFLLRITPHQFALRNYMAFHRRIELASLSAER